MVCLGLPLHTLPSPCLRHIELLCSFLPQGLCSCWFLCLECFSPWYLCDWLNLTHVLVQMLAPRRSLLWPLDKIDTPQPPKAQSLSSAITLFYCFHSTYYSLYLCYLYYLCHFVYLSFIYLFIHVHIPTRRNSMQAGFPLSCSILYIQRIVVCFQ